MEFYLKSRVIHTQSFKKSATSESLLKRWATEGKQFSILQAVAQQYLSCNATSVASQRLFSFSGNVVSKKSSCLKPGKVAMLSCVADNLKMN